MIGGTGVPNAGRLNLLWHRRRSRPKGALLSGPPKFFETADCLADMGLGEQAALAFVPAAYDPGQNRRTGRLPGSFPSGRLVNGCQQSGTMRRSESRHQFRDRADPVSGSVARVLPDPAPGFPEARHLPTAAGSSNRLRRT